MENSHFYDDCKKNIFYYSDCKFLMLVRLLFAFFVCVSITAAAVACLLLRRDSSSSSGSTVVSHQFACCAFSPNINNLLSTVKLVRFELSKWINFSWLGRQQAMYGARGCEIYHKKILPSTQFIHENRWSGKYLKDLIWNWTFSSTCSATRSYSFHER